MRLSIIIPTLNAAGTLASLLQSIFQQETSVPFEVIVVDGLSTDGTVEVASQFPVTIIEKETTIYSAQNEGIKQATGDYLYFIGADDLLADGAIDLIASNTAPLLKAFVHFIGSRFPVPSSYQQATVYAKELFEQHGDFDLIHPVYADIWFKKRLKAAGIEPAHVAGIFAHVAKGGFSSCTKDVM